VNAVAAVLLLCNPVQAWALVQPGSGLGTPKLG